MARIKAASDEEGSLGLWRCLSAGLTSERIDTAVLACTDLDAILKSMTTTTPLQIVDSLLCLTRSDSSGVEGVSMDMHEYGVMRDQH